MSELKSFIVLYDGKFIRAYEESEADKFIADLEESHKMEVEQLLIEIAELKETLNNSRNARKYWRKEYLIEYKEILHQKHKRCLAMALLWLNRAENSTDLENELVSRKRCCKWMELAEVFKEAK